MAFKKSRCVLLVLVLVYQPCCLHSNSYTPDQNHSSCSVICLGPPQCFHAISKSHIEPQPKPEYGQLPISGVELYGYSEISIDTMSVLPLDEPLSDLRQSQYISRSVSFISSIIVCYACTIICSTARLYLKATKCVMLFDDCEIILKSISR